jgi:hypothetical protein
MTDFYIKQVVVAPSTITTVDTHALVTQEGGNKVIINMDDAGVIRVEPSNTQVVVNDAGLTKIAVQPVQVAPVNVAACVQGPPGASAVSPVVTAAVDIAPRRAIALNADSLAIYASASNYSAKAVIGISAMGAVAGNKLNVLTTGGMEWPDGNLEPDKPLFLSEGGLLSQVVPTHKWSRQLATAISPTSIVVDINDSYYIGD